MASPVGHVLVGAAVASIMARETGTPMTPAFWAGVIVSSGLPDLDLVLARFDMSGPRYHRNGSHSLIVLGAVSVVTYWLTAVVLNIASPGMVACWIVALFSHPLLDVVTTGPDIAARGYGIGLLWPFSARRFSVRRPVVQSPDLDTWKGLRHLVGVLRPEVLVLGPPCLVVLLLASMF